MKRIVLACLAALCSAAMACAQKAEPNYQSKQPYKSWVNMAPKLEDDFFKTDEARRIGDNVLLYQQTTGGWPKNIYMPAALDEKELEEVLSEKDDVNQSTIDNKATTTEITWPASTTSRTTRSTRKPSSTASTTCSRHNTTTVDGPSSIPAPKATTRTSPTTTTP
jgi:hypothetical protein